METDTTFKLLDTVALLTDATALSLNSDHQLSLLRGQIGTVVEATDQNMVIVEFADRNGKALALVSVAAHDLLRLHHGEGQRVALDDIKAMISEGRD